MRSVNLDYTISYVEDDYTRERCIWTHRTDDQFYPLSYSLQECLELICEYLGWEYEHHEIFSGGRSGTLHAMGPEPRKLDTGVFVEWWPHTGTPSNSYYYYEAGNV